MPKNLFRKSIYTSSSVIFVSCAQIPPPQPVNIEPSGHVIGHVHAVQITKIRALQENNLLKVQVEVLNNRGTRDVLYYRVRWLDKNGMMIGHYDPWRAETFEGGQSSVVGFVAPSKQIADFRLELKPDY